MLRKVVMLDIYVLLCTTLNARTFEKFVSALDIVKYFTSYRIKLSVVN